MKWNSAVMDDPDDDDFIAQSDSNVCKDRKTLRHNVFHWTVGQREKRKSTVAFSFHFVYVCKKIYHMHRKMAYLTVTIIKQQ